MPNNAEIAKNAIDDFKKLYGSGERGKRNQNICQIKGRIPLFKSNP